MREKLIALIESETGFKGAMDSTPIDALGIDSLDFICLLQMIRVELGPISNDAATSAQTVGDLIAAVGA